MSIPTPQAANPSVQHFAGDEPARVARRLFAATRPSFYPASALPVVAGTAWGYGAARELDLAAFAIALFTTVCVHAGANVLNDVGDDDSGTDRHNEQRIYPFTGGSRFIQTGIMTNAAMARLGWALLGAAAVAGLLLFYLKGPVVLAFGLAGIALAVVYSLGPLRLSALGLGEAAVGIAFGVIPVVGAAWLQSGVVDTSSVLFSLPVSLWVAAILLINGVPDMAADAAAGKRTLPVRLGLAGTSIVYLMLNLLAVVAFVALWYQGGIALAALFVPAACLVPAAMAASAIRAGLADRKAMTGAIKMTLGIHTAGSLWLAAAAIYPAL